MVELYWSERERESESDIAWNGYIDLSVVCLHWVVMSSDKDQREFSLSLSRSALRLGHPSFETHIINYHSDIIFGPK